VEDGEHFTPSATMRNLPITGPKYWDQSTGGRKGGGEVGCKGKRSRKPQKVDRCGHKCTTSKKRKITLNVSFKCTERLPYGRGGGIMGTQATVSILILGSPLDVCPMSKAVNFQEGVFTGTLQSS